MQQIHIDNKDYLDDFLDYIGNGVKFSIEDEKLLTSEYSFTFSPENSGLLENYQQYLNPLIYGKNTMLGIVAIEQPEHNQLELFFTNGTSKRFPYKPWILFEEKIDNKCQRLEGFLTYKYIRFFEEGEEFWRYKNKSFQIWNQKEAAMALHGMTMFKGLQPQNLAVLSFDIESAGLSLDEESEVYLITNVFTKNGVRIAKHFREDHYSSQSDFIDSWCQWVRKVNPDVITAWNGFGYDIPYLDYVARKNGTSLKLGRDGSDVTFNKKPSEYRVDGNTSWSYKKCQIYGRHFIDGMFLAVKYDFGRAYPSWSLKAIAEFEGMKKPDRQMYDASKIRDNWSDPVEREKIVQYGIDDSEDSLNLYEKMITAYFYMNQSLPIPFQDMMTGATGKWMNSIVVRSYLQENKTIPKPDEKQKVHGGISFGNPGLYKNLFKVDVTSLYPSCILTYNIYPTKKDPEQNFLKMVRFFTNERVSNKKKYKTTKERYYDDLQAAQKIAINSSYGMLGTSGLAFNDFSAANQVTLKGRGVLRKAIIWASGKDVGEWFQGYDYSKDEGINEELNEWDIRTGQYISNSFIIGPTDTDSISFCKSDMSSFTDQEQSGLLNNLNSIMDPGISFEDDGYFSHVLAVAAKNYCLVESGQTKIKYKGSSIKDAKKEPALREFMDKCIHNLIYEQPLEQIYEQYCTEARNITDISRWAVKKSISKKLLTSTRKNETNVTDALGDLSQYREGDKVFVYNAQSKFVPVVVDEMEVDYENTQWDLETNEPIGEIIYKPTGKKVHVLYKSGKNKGKPKLEEQKVLKLTENWDNDANVEHYLDRVYSTLSIFEEVVDMSQFLCYKE